jgi:hypothetical protein
MTIRTIAFGALGAAVLLMSALAVAQGMHDGNGPAAPMPADHMMQHHGAMPGDGMMGMHHAMNAGEPISPGQAAFGAVQEIVRLLEADPNTDWSKVDLGALREHLIDMDEVTMRAVATETPIDGGLAIAVTGTGRTLVAIQRMIPAHAAALNGVHGWTVAASTMPDGARLTVTAADAKEVAHIRGLGFIGLLASGPHHQMHHLAMAKGALPVH